MINKLAYYLLPLNILIDALLLFSDTLFWLPFLRAFFLLTIIIYLLAKYQNHFKQYSGVIVYLSYCLVQLFFVSDFEKSLSITLKICIPIASFIIGYRLFSSLEQLRKLSISLIFVYFILILNFGISQFYQLGNALYSEESNFRVGNFDDSWNVFTYSVLMAPFSLFFLRNNKLGKSLIYIGSIINGILVFISIKRIAIIGLFSGNIIRVLFIKKNIKLFYSIVFVCLTGFIAFQYLEDAIMSRIEARSNRFEEGAIEREGRYLETQYVWDEIFSFENPAKSLFGLEGFNSVGNYANGLFGDRQLHVDYNLIANTTGLVGLFLYIFLFVQMSIRFYYLVKYLKLNNDIDILLKSVFWMLLINQFITSLGGQMYHMSYRIIVFLFLGTIMGYFSKKQLAFNGRRNFIAKEENRSFVPNKRFNRSKSW